ncbi:MAG: HDOD domain-containing protein [Nitrosospira sp.]|nr:HDOD domain-containing protein [Nitrosospira sp.]
MTTLISTLKNGKAGFFELIQKRMEEKGDFPALSKSVRNFSETAQDENFSVAGITGTILSDFSLTQKVIRLANSAMYASIGGEITTISKAAMIVGVDALSYLVLSVRLVDTLSVNAPDSAAARTEMAKALLAGDITRGVAAKAHIANAEEAVVCALMHHLGRLLVVFYFPEEWSRIEEVSASKSLSRNAAALEVIGMTLDEISQEIASRWRLPKKIANSMMSPTSSVETSIPGSPGWLKMVASFAGEAAAAVTSHDTGNGLTEPLWRRRRSDRDESANKNAGNGLMELASLYSNALLVPVEAIMESINFAVRDARESSILEAVSVPNGKPTDSTQQLAAGVNETANALAKGTNFGNILNLVLETIYAGMSFNRVVAFLRDGDAFKGRLGFGNAMPEALSSLSFPETYAADVFHLALANNADVFIADVIGPKSAASIPSWLTETLPDVRAFILLPMNLNGCPVGLLYGDWRKGTTEIVEQDEMVLMRTLRDNLMKSLVSK